MLFEVGNKRRTMAYANGMSDEPLDMYSFNYPRGEDVWSFRGVIHPHGAVYALQRTEEDGGDLIDLPSRRSQGQRMTPFSDIEATFSQQK